MLAIVAAYLTFVGVGTFVMKRLPGDGFRFYGLSFVYNIVQVMLCSYMCIESLVIALRQGYTLTPCNTFGVVGAPVAKVLWLFYMSKVLDFMDIFVPHVGYRSRSMLWYVLGEKLRTQTPRKGSNSPGSKIHDVCNKCEELGN